MVSALQEARERRSSRSEDAMKVTVEFECTPEEARSFLGLPDMTPLNERLVDQMVSNTQSGLNMFQPDEMMKNWMALGGQAQEQFRRMMSAGVPGASSAAGSTKRER